MAGLGINVPSSPFVQIDESLCNGCVICMKACPTKAIRVREPGVANIEGTCIHCGECIRVCPEGAIKEMPLRPYDVEKGRYSVVTASPVLYVQFGEEVLPNDILLALRKLGYTTVHDQAYTNEIFNYAIELFIRENREKKLLPSPLISPICPVVLRLIAYKFPSLLNHIPPLITPREIVAREAKKRVSKKRGCTPEEVKVFHITPCSSKMVSVNNSYLQEDSYFDGAIPISEIYEPLKKSLPQVEEDIVLHHSGGVGLGWGASGGEVAGLDMDCLAVSGLQETIRYLEKTEMGFLEDIDYIEFRTCTEGCLGGPFAVTDKYLAKHYLRRLFRMFGVEKRVKYAYVKKLYEEGWFFPETQHVPGLEKKHPPVSSTDLSRRIEKQEQIEELLKFLPHKECGLCGCPDCRTFAEDVVNGKASPEDCIYYSSPLYAKGRSCGVQTPKIPDGEKTSSDSHT